MASPVKPEAVSSVVKRVVFDQAKISIIPARASDCIYHSADNDDDDEDDGDHEGTCKLFDD